MFTWAFSFYGSGKHRVSMAANSQTVKTLADRYQVTRLQVEGPTLQGELHGLYVAVTPAGSISFSYSYSINSRQEAITVGRYFIGGITWAEARERLGEAKRMVADGTGLYPKRC